jgi:S-adenosylmethionine:tRNA ribosyltransferase-isomerase
VGDRPAPCPACLPPKPETSAADPIARTRPLARDAVAGIGEGAAVERKTAAADAFGEAAHRPRHRISIFDAILSGVHEAGESHFELLRAFTNETTLERMTPELEMHRYRSHEFGDSLLIERGAQSSARMRHTPCVGTRARTFAGDAAMAS